MKKTYQTPNTQVLQVETAILCASGPNYISPKGTLKPIGKSTETSW